MNTFVLHIDNLSFAKKGEKLSGQLDLASCPRLSEMLLSQIPHGLKSNSSDLQPSTISFLLRGELDAQGRSFIHSEINAELTTYCQRCLESISLPFKLNFSYLIAFENVESGEELSVDDNDEFDLQEPDKAMDVAALIEDELIMALPIAPTDDFDCAKLTTQAGDKPNPFAVLKDLIKKT